jgi:hypothetical protein
MERKLFTQLFAQSVEGRARLHWYITTPPAMAVIRGEVDYHQRPIRIYRLVAEGFRWGEDYEEFFHAARVEDASLIHEGVMTPLNKRKFEFVDDGVAPRTSYCYWVAQEGWPPTGPAVVRVTDPAVWWPSSRVFGEMDRLAREYPGLVTVEQFGATARARPLRGIRIGAKDPCVAFIGTVHAGESGPELMLPAFERLLREEPALLRKAGIAALPTTNYEERDRIVLGTSWYLRVNARGVDINRNFDADWDEVDYMYGLISDDPDASTYRGPAPESEPETQAIVRFLRETSPRAVFCYHWLSSICGPGMLMAKKAAHDAEYVAQCTRFTNAYSGAFLGNPDKALGPHPGTTAGSLCLWVYRNLGVPSVDLEGDPSVPAEKASTNDLTTPDLVAEYSDRHCEGIRAALRMVACQ